MALGVVAPAAAVAQNQQRMLNQVTDRVLQLLRLLFVVTEGVILVRVAFKALGADGSAAFAAFVYKVSAPLVAPFHPIFHDQQFNSHPLEVGSLVAVVFYAIAL
jgi:uncharacterized protein YggT (Ycf19 family)